MAIYQGDCRDLIPALGLRPALVLADPPYGVSERTDRASKGRGTPDCPANDFPPVAGDDEPFDPAHLLQFRRLILWGGNYFAERLPASPSWLVWDKLNGLSTEKRPIGFDDNADVEMAWSNLGGPARLIPHRWKGFIKESERAERRVHPTQKPIVLMERLIELYTKPGDLILDPYMGSGPTLIAALRTGRRAVGIELDPHYCGIAADRIDREIVQMAA